MDTLLTRLRNATVLRVLRVNQVDATELDTQLTMMLKASLKQILALLTPQTRAPWFERREPELTLALQLVMFALSVWPANATYGLQLRSLKYRDERRSTVAFDATPTALQKLAWALLHFVTPWLVVRASRWSLESDTDSDNNERSVRGRVWQVLQRAETVYGVASLLNLAVFLYDGKYRSIVDRVLCMRLVYARRRVSREVSFEFQNRQIVWHAFTEFLLFLMPLVNLQQLRSTIVRRLAALTLPAKPPDAADADEKDHPSAASDSTCTICAVDPIGLPHEAPCGHRFCYACIQGALLASPTRTVDCPRCGDPIDSITRVTM